MYVRKRLKNVNRIDRFKREIETVSNLLHENIVHLDWAEKSSGGRKRCQTVETHGREVGSACSLKTKARCDRFAISFRRQVEV